jgi:DNA-binding response OmpR family regulator
MTGSALRGRRILIVEDDYLIAMAIADLLEDAGAEVIGPIAQLDQALAFVEDNAKAFDAAVLDVDLRGRKSYPIADVLAAREVRFVFSTGYGAEAIDHPYRGYPRCDKPIDATVLVAALSGA